MKKIILCKLPDGRLTEYQAECFAGTIADDETLLSAVRKCLVYDGELSPADLPAVQFEILESPALH